MAPFDALGVLYSNVLSCVSAAVAYDESDFPIMIAETPRDAGSLLVLLLGIRFLFPRVICDFAYASPSILLDTVAKGLAPKTLAATLSSSRSASAAVPNSQESLAFFVMIFFTRDTLKGSVALKTPAKKIWKATRCLVHILKS